jgi:hypothetical protein
MADINAGVAIGKVVNVHTTVDTRFQSDIAKNLMAAIGIRENVRGHQLGGTSQRAFGNEPAQSRIGFSAVPLLGIEVERPVQPVGRHLGNGVTAGAQ